MCHSGWSEAETRTKIAQRVERPEGGPQGERNESTRGLFSMRSGFPLARE